MKETSPSMDEDGGDTQKLCIDTSGRNDHGFDYPANNIEFQRVHRISKAKPIKAKRANCKITAFF